MPTVINRHHYRGKDLPEPWLYVGRGTPLGNPYTLAEHGMNALPLYKAWLWRQIRSGSPLVLAALRSITPEHHLVCSCAPRACHADIIVRAWLWLRDVEAGQPSQADGSSE